jgi:hypothetical protein
MSWLAWPISSRKGRAVRLDEGPPAQQLVDRAGDHPLSGPRLPGEKDGGPLGRLDPGLGEPLRLGEYLEQRRIRADDAGRHGPIPLPVVGELPLVALARQDALHQQAELVEVQRLLEVVGRAPPHGLYGVVHRPVGGHQHHLDRGVDPEDLRQELEARAVREAEVEEHQVGRLLAHPVDAVGSGLGDPHVVIRAGQRLRDLAAEQALVLDDQDRGHAERVPFSPRDDGGRWVNCPGFSPWRGICPFGDTSMLQVNWLGVGSSGPSDPGHPETQGKESALPPLGMPIARRRRHRPLAQSGGVS